MAIVTWLEGCSSSLCQSVNTEAAQFLGTTWKLLRQWPKCGETGFRFQPGDLFFWRYSDFYCSYSSLHYKQCEYKLQLYPVILKSQGKEKIVRNNRSRINTLCCQKTVKFFVCFEIFDYFLDDEGELAHMAAHLVRNLN